MSAVSGQSAVLVAIGLGVLACACSGGSSGSVVSPPARNVRLLDVQTQVFGPRCAHPGCHAGSGAPFGLDLSSVQTSGANLVGVPSAEAPSLNRIEPWNAADSYLYRKITADPRIQGDPMPLQGGPLGAADLDLIATWIDQGAM